MPQFEAECGVKCRSRKHASEFNAAVSKGTLAEIKAYSNLCHNAAQFSDVWGRSALHIAAACGKCDVLQWLLDEKKVEVPKRDTESGWTALHRALFYGQLASARLLIQYNSDLYSRDHEGLSPLDMAMKDKPLHCALSSGDPSELYTWGDNSNYTLGLLTEHRRSVPEAVDVFSKQNISIKQVVMCKYHTVFMSNTGQVYTCGHGQGGRLGHGTEATLLAPKLMEALKDETCTMISASKDHTAVLTSSGAVYSWGLNNNQQLGHSAGQEKCLIPRPVLLKQLKGRSIMGVCTGRFHTVVYTTDILLTFGLNAGQLGHPKMKGQERIVQPKPVTSLTLKDSVITTVSCSDAATVVLTTAGDIYVLHEYQCRKIASKQQDVAEIHVVGGHLDHTDSQILQEKGGTELIIALHTLAKKVLIWRSTRPSLKRAHWQIKRQLYVETFVLTETNMAFVTTEGEGFIGNFSNKNMQTKDLQQLVKEKESRFGEVTLLDLLINDEAEEIQLHKIPNVHRGIYISADKKGRNYAVVQSQPNLNVLNLPSVSDSEMADNFSRLWDEADEYDLIHDVILEVNGHTWPAHRYILMSRCAKHDNLLGQIDKLDSSPDCPVVTVTGVHPQIFEQLIEYIYTDTCDLLMEGSEFELLDTRSAEDENIFNMDLETDVDNNCVDMNEFGKMSAFAVNQKLKTKENTSSKKSKQYHGKDPVKQMEDAAKRFGVEGLYKKLESVKYSKGMIVSTGEKMVSRQNLKFDRSKFSGLQWSLYDVCIQSDDKQEIPCHKCVLVARLEYFHSMLSSGWMETSASTALTLPIPGDVLEILIEYLYTDNADIVHNCHNVELICNVLVVADQMLITRLKEICETAIYPHVTLKNAGELLEFSSMYNAKQLKCYCQQYIAVNLGSLLETRGLDVLSEGVMQELIAYYRDSIPNMSRRMITPLDEGPTKSFLESLVVDPGEVTPTSAKKTRTHKKRNRTKSGMEDTEKSSRRGNRRVSERQLSISSDISLKSDDDLTEEMAELVIVESSCQTKIPEKSPYKASHSNKKKSAKITVNTAGYRNADSHSTLLTEEPASPPDKMSPSGQGPWARPTLNKDNQSVVLKSSNSSPNQSAKKSVSLRDIMEQQQESNAPSSKTSGNKKRFSWKDVKKQQQLENQEKVKGSKSDESQISSPVKFEQPKPSCPWGGVSQVVQSFRSLMVSEEASSVTTTTTTTGKPPHTSVKSPTAVTGKSTTPSPSARQSGSSSTVSWGLPGSNRSNKKSVSLQIDKKGPLTTDAPMASPRSPDNPWQMDTAQSPPPRDLFSFSDIVKDEIEKSDVLMKTAKKPLALIQMEEQAIQELLDYYRAADRIDEMITVQRVPQLAATPIWKRERIQST